MKNSYRAAAIAACLAVSRASAQDLPDFSGTWEMNPDKGENLGMAAAVKITVVIYQTAEELVVDHTNVCDPPPGV